MRSHPSGLTPVRPCGVNITSTVQTPDGRSFTPDSRGLFWVPPDVAGSLCQSMNFERVEHEAGP